MARDSQNDPQASHWTLELDAYLRDNLLALLNWIGSGGFEGRRVEPLHLANTGDWCYMLVDMLRAVDGGTDAYATGTPNRSVDEMRLYLRLWLESHPTPAVGLPVGVPDEPPTDWWPADRYDDSYGPWCKGCERYVEHCSHNPAVGVPETTEPDPLRNDAQYFPPVEPDPPKGPIWYGPEPHHWNGHAWEPMTTGPEHEPMLSTRSAMAWRARGVRAERDRALAARTQVGWWSPTEHALRPLGTFHPNEALMYLYVPVWVEAVPGTSEGDDQ